jgi:hypothetical protein
MRALALSSSTFISTCCPEPRACQYRIVVPVGGLAVAITYLLRCLTLFLKHLCIHAVALGGDYLHTHALVISREHAAAEMVPRAAVVIMAAAAAAAAAAAVVVITLSISSRLLRVDALSSCIR